MFEKAIIAYDKSFILDKLDTRAKNILIDKITCLLNLKKYQEVISLANELTTQPGKLKIQEKKFLLESIETCYQAYGKLNIAEIFHTEAMRYEDLLKNKGHDFQSQTEGKEKFSLDPDAIQREQNTRLRLDDGIALAKLPCNNLSDSSFCDSDQNALSLIQEFPEEEKVCTQVKIKDKELSSYLLQNQGEDIQYYTSSPVKQYSNVTKKQYIIKTKKLYDFSVLNPKRKADDLGLSLIREQDFVNFNLDQQALKDQQALEQLISPSIKEDQIKSSKKENKESNSSFVTK